MEAVIVKIEAKDRTEGKNPRQLRAEGLLPITVYGKDVNLNIAVDMHDFKIAYQKNKDTQFEISYAKKSYKTTTKNVQINYATNEIQSAEFAIA